MKPRRALPFLMIAALLSGSIVYWVLTSPASQSDVPGSNTATPSDNPDKDPRPETEPERTRRLLLGVWQDEYRGKRTMTLKADGSGTMLVEVSGLQASLFASQLRFDMQWSLDGTKLTKKTVGGEPAGKVNLILTTMGDTAEDTLLEITEDRLLLLDQDGSTRYDWKRVRQDAE